MQKKFVKSPPPSINDSSTSNDASLTSIFRTQSAEKKQKLQPKAKEKRKKNTKTKPPTPLMFKLGESYQHRKEKLKEELRLEYRKALAEELIDPKKNNAKQKTFETHEEILNRKRRQEKDYRNDETDVAHATHKDFWKAGSHPDQGCFTGLQIGKELTPIEIKIKKDEYRSDLLKQIHEKEAMKRRSKQMEMVGNTSNLKYTESKGNAQLANGIDKTKQNFAKNSNLLEDKKRKQTNTKSAQNEGELHDRKIWLPHYPVTPYFMSAPAPGYYEAPRLWPHNEIPYHYPPRYPIDPRFQSTTTGGQAAHQPFFDSATTQTQYNSPVSTTMNKTGDRVSQQVQGGENSPGPKSVSNLKSSLISDEARDKLRKKEMMEQYQKELEEQIKAKQKECQIAKTQNENYERQLMQQTMNYDPWGKGGGGAPMKDPCGNLVSDLRQMHFENETLKNNPMKAATVSMQKQEAAKREKEVSSISRGLAKTQDIPMSSRFGQSDLFDAKETLEQKSRKTVYKNILQKQIDEHRRLEAIRKEEDKIRNEEEEKKMVEENRKMREEYEREKKKTKDKLLEKQRQNEEIIRAALAQKREGEQKKLQEKIQHEEEERKIQEQELQERLNQSYKIIETRKARNASSKVVGEQPIVNKSVATKQPTTTNKSIKHKDGIEESTAGLKQPLPRLKESSAITKAQKDSSAPSKLVSEQPNVNKSITTKQPTTTNKSIKHKDGIQESTAGLEQPQSPSVVRNGESLERERICKELTELKTQLLVEQQEIEKEMRANNSQLAMLPTRSSEQFADLSQIRQLRDHVKKFVYLGRRPDSSNTGHEAITSKPTMRRDPDGFHNNGIVPKYQRSGLPHSESHTSLLDTDTVYIPVVDGSLVDVASRIRYSDRDGRKTGEPTGYIRVHVRPAGRANGAENNINSLTTFDSFATTDTATISSLDPNQTTSLNTAGDDKSLTQQDQVLDRFVSQRKSFLSHASPTFRSVSDKYPQSTSLSTEPSQQAGSSYTHLLKFKNLMNPMHHTDEI